ncbi:MAG: SurA N-terminal domain-containing protein [Dokdonella sp.]|nr:SurA N-terminal domain-containing protein [Dokdonella sp.]
MLSRLRTILKSWVGIAVLGLILIGFSFFGIESYFVSQSDASVARIGDQEISQDQFRDRFNDYRQNMIRQQGEGFDSRLLDSPLVRRQVLDSMIDERIVLDANEKLGVRVPDTRVREAIMEIPAFQRDGKFDPEQYRALLSMQGMSSRALEQDIRTSIATRELPMSLYATTFVTDAEVDTYLRLREQKRDFSFVRLDKPAAADETVSDEEIKTFYDAHQSDYMNPEQVALEYLELDAAQLKVELDPSEAVLRERYENEKSRFTTEEQRLASHILVKVGGSGGPDEQKQALTKAEGIVKRLREGASFADVAKQESDDLGSRNQGGDLGWLEKGMTDPAFETALFALAPKTVSDPVLGSDGYHIIELRDTRPGDVRSFEEVRTELAAEYAETERERVYNEKSGRLVDLVYQDPSSLQNAAQEVGLEVGRTGLFSRDGAPEGIAANPAVARAAFSDAVLIEGHNSEAIDLGPNHIAFVRLAERKPAEAKPLADVSAQIKARIVAERVAAAAKQRADELFARIEKGEPLSALAGELKLEVSEQKAIGRNAVNLDAALVQAVFAMPRVEEGKPAFRSVALGDDAYALVRLDKVVDGDPSALDAATREAARTTLQQGQGYLATQDFVAALRSEVKPVINEKNLN